MPRGNKWGWQKRYTMTINDLLSILPCQCQGVNANCYIGYFAVPTGKIGRTCEREWLYLGQGSGILAKNRTCDFWKRDMRFGRIAPAISRDRTCDSAGPHRVQKTKGSEEKTVE